jgi:hypothetical protein
MNILKKEFTRVYKGNTWGDKESRSGGGSSLEQTNTIRKEIPKLIKSRGIKTILDIPCGDFLWMKEIQIEVDGLIEKYIGADIVEELIFKNKELYENNKHSFVIADILDYDLPTVDLIICRDLFLHLSFSGILKSLKNIKKSRSKYLLVSTFTRDFKNLDIRKLSLNGRRINLEKFPFLINRYLKIINENNTEHGDDYADKSLMFIVIETLSLNKIEFFIMLYYIIELPNMLIVLTNKCFRKILKL